MFSIKTIEDNIHNYSKEELTRKIQVVGIKSKDLQEQIQNLMKEISDAEMRNITLQLNMHGVVKDRVQDNERIVFDSNFVKYGPKMQKQVQNQDNTYKILLKQNQLIQKNYKLIEDQNTNTKSKIKQINDKIRNITQEGEEEINKLKQEEENNKKIQQQLLLKKNNIQKQLDSLLTFYQNIDSDIQNLSATKNDINQKNQDVLLDIRFLKQDSELRHQKYSQKIQRSKKAISRMEKDLIKVESKLHEIQTENQTLYIVKSEILQSKH